MLARDTILHHALRVLSLIFLILSVSGIEVVQEGYSLLVDAGSTGSRAFVFHFTEVWEAPAKADNAVSITALLGDVPDIKVKPRTLLSRTVVSLPGMKIKKGISTFANAAHWEDIVQHLLPIFVNASQTIPRDKWASTSVYMKGTAGMRLLPMQKQALIWSHVMHLNQYPGNPFSIVFENLGTIDGSAEAYYAVLASNYIAKAIDGRLHRIAGAEMVGALDMGGSSTQLIFYRGGGGVENSATDSTGGAETDRISAETQGSATKHGPVKASDFWSHSWLSFGVEVVRERYQQTLIAAHLAAAAAASAQQEEVGTPAEVTNGNKGENSGFISVLNPCTHKGFWTDWTGFVSLVDSVGDVQQRKDSQTYRLVGTGDPAKCIALLGELMWPTGSCAEQLAHIGATAEDRDRAVPLAQQACFLGDVSHPPMQGHFYGMSVYYYANDAVRTLLGEDGKKLFANWPNPTVDELEAAAHTFCKLPWPGDPLDKTTNTWKNKHPYSGTKQLPHRCFESLYMSLVLEHAFGFARDARLITFALDVEGNEVEWTLGYALAHATATATLSAPAQAQNASAVIEKAFSYAWQVLELLCRVVSGSSGDRKEL